MSGHAQADEDQGATGRDETPAERIDRNWDDLLQELRVSQTGVQILTGFLLTLPLTQRFTELDDFQRGTYVVAVLLSVLATCVLVAPVSTHRVLFRKQEKDMLVAAADVLAKIGLAVLALAVAVVVLFILEIVLGREKALWIAGGVLTCYVLGWGGLPFVLLARARRHDG